MSHGAGRLLLGLESLCLHYTIPIDSVRRPCSQGLAALQKVQMVARLPDVSSRATPCTLTTALHHWSTLLSNPYYDALELSNEPRQA